MIQTFEMIFSQSDSLANQRAQSITPLAFNTPAQCLPPTPMLILKTASLERRERCQLTNELDPPRRAGPEVGFGLTIPENNDKELHNVHLLSKDRGRATITEHWYTHINPQDNEGTKTEPEQRLATWPERSPATRRERGRRSSQGTSDRSYIDDVVIYPLAIC